MVYTIIQNGVDITDKIEVTRCVMYDRFGEMLDDFDLAFTTKNDLSFSKGDEIVINAKNYTTGSMYIDEERNSYGAYVVRGVSLKSSQRALKSRLWRDVRLHEVISDVAENCGLDAVVYGIEDFSYKSLFQARETDLAFLSRICKREGYSVKVDNERLIIFNDKVIENAEPVPLSIEDVYTNWQFVKSSKCLHDFTVSYYDIDTGLFITHTAKDDSIIGGSKKIIESMSGYDEAIRFSTNYLKDANKNRITGSLSMDFNSGISAGTVIKTSGFGTFDDTYIVTEVAHNPIKKTTTIKIRKV